MDPISLAIVAALGKLGENVIKDSYEALKAAIAHKCGVDSELAKAVATVEKKPDSAARKEILKEEVAAAKLEQDPEILRAAHALIAKIKELPDGQTIITQTVTGDKNIFSGTGNVTVTNNT